MGVGTGLLMAGGVAVGIGGGALIGAALSGDGGEAILSGAGDAAESVGGFISSLF